MVSISSSNRAAVAEAERQVKLILDPPTPELGVTYQGRVVNITNFGAFVNIMPGRDGLVHISKIGGKRRIDRVEDEVSLGDIMEVIVEDIDPNGKISLMPAEFAEELMAGREAGESSGGDGGGRSRDRGDRSDRGGDRGGRSRDGGGGRSRDGGGGRSRDGGGDRGGRSRDGGGDRGGRSRDGGGDRAPRDRDNGSTRTDTKVEVVSFNDAFDAEQSNRYGDLD